MMSKEDLKEQSIEPRILGEDDYEILDAERPDDQEKARDYADDFIKVMLEAQSNVDAKLAQYGISGDLEISEEEAVKVAKSMLDGTLDATLQYIRDKYILKDPELPPGNDKEV